MSSPLKQNTITIQELLNTVNNLPKVNDVENLDIELNAQSDLISEQDAKIAELAQVLADKAGCNGNNFKTAEITIQSSNRTIVSIVYTGVENMVPTAKYLYVAGESVVVTAVQGTSIIVQVDSITSTNASGAVCALNRNNNNTNYISSPSIRCYHIVYDSGDTGLITIV